MRTGFLRTVKLVWLCTFLFFAIGCSLSPSQPPTTSLTQPAPTDEAQMQGLIEAIVQDLALAGGKDHFIAQLANMSGNVTAASEVSPASVQTCWLSQGNRLINCAPTEVAESFNHTGFGEWKYGYMFFSIMSVDQQYTRATIQLSQKFGLGTGSYLLLTYARVNGKWREKSRQMLETE